MDILNFLLALACVNILVICVKLFDALLDSHSMFKSYCYCYVSRRSNFVITVAFFVLNIVSIASVIIRPIESGIWQIAAGLNLFAQTMCLHHLLEQEKDRHLYHKCKKPHAK